MSFDARDIREGVDVFSLDNVYLGTVVRVRWAGQGWLAGRRTQQRSAPPALRKKPTAFSGERLGPMPTATIGNAGPASQSSDTRYGSEPSSPDWATSQEPAELLIFRWLVSLNWATARPVLRRIPAGLIHLVSLERIILSVSAETILPARPAR